MEKVLNLYKNEGETPLQCLERFRAGNPEYKDLPLSYVGRLDPLASGVLLVVAGEENKNREAYLGLDKEYECEVLFGFETDTHDVLGLVTDSSADVGEEVKSLAENTLKEFVGTYKQNYPAFSSKTALGKPLFAHAREGTINLENLPSHEVNVSEIKVLGWRTISAGDLHMAIQEKIVRVSGDFRQKEILEKWQEIFAGIARAKIFSILSLRISSGSGFYVRTFASDLGKKIGIPALVFKIVRTRVGEHCLPAVPMV